MTITNLDAPQEMKVPFHPKDPTGARCGFKTIVITDKLFLEQEDCVGMSKDEEITLMKWGNVFIRSIERDGSGAVLAIEAEANPNGNPKSTEEGRVGSDVDGVVKIDLHEMDTYLTFPKYPRTKTRTLLENSKTTLQRTPMLRHQRWANQASETPKK